MTFAVYSDPNPASVEHEQIEDGGLEIAIRYVDRSDQDSLYRGLVITCLRWEFDIQ